MPDRSNTRLIPARAVCLALTVALGACKGGGDPVEQAVREASAKYQADALRTTEEHEAAQANTPASPEAAAVARAIADAEADRARHVALAASTQDAALRRLSEAAIARRDAELAELRAWQPPSE